MLIFQRDLEPILRKTLFKNKIIVIFGPRQSGKTTLSKKIVESFGVEGQYFDCQLIDVRESFVVGEPSKLKSLIGDKKIVVFDEAQTIENIGSVLKIFHDHYPDVQVIATGSSSFDLANKIIEPMTGRAIEYTLLPLSLSEIKRTKNITRKDLMDIFQYGTYPAIIAAETVDDKKNALKNIATNYLYKDIFIFEQIRYPLVFEKILKALSLQIGSLVSIYELAQIAETSPQTVNRYLKLLEQAFIVRIVRPFSSNPRTEIRKAFKVYFLDIGIRNVLADINTPVPDRIDKGFIFENFYFCELIKRHSLEIFPPEILFWRTRTKFEVDFIEKDGLKIKATECKWSDEKVVFKNFLKEYPGSEVGVVTVDTLISEM